MTNITLPGEDINRASDEIAHFFVEAFLEYHENLWKKERLEQIIKEDEAMKPGEFTLG